MKFLGTNTGKNKATIFDANGKLIASSVNSTELGYLSGVTSAVQTQLNGKAASSHTHDDRYYTESEVNNIILGLQVRRTYSLPATIGWYRIAASNVDINHNSARFEIDWSASGCHGRTIFNAACTYGKSESATLNQTQYSSFAPGAGITKARVVYHTTYSANYAYLEVYLASAHAVALTVEVQNPVGWQNVYSASTVGSIPTGYSNVEIPLDEGFVTEGQFISTVATGTAPMVVSSTTMVSNLNANLLEGNRASAFAAVSHNHTSSQISDATNANTANMIVKRDASGNFNAGTISASLNGNASSASGLKTFAPSRLADANIAVTSSNIGTVDFCIASSSMTTNKPPTGDGHILTFHWDNTGGYDAQLALKHTTGDIAVRGMNAGIWSTWQNILSETNYTNYTVSKTGSGASGSWGISVTGNAATATKLQTARTINGVAFDGTANITITANPNSHTHDDRYYTEAEINDRLNNLVDNFVVSGCAVTTNATALTVSIAAGSVFVSGIKRSISATTKTVTAAATNYIYVDTAGAVIASTTAPTGDYADLATIASTAAGTVVAAGSITDTRDVVTNANGKITWDLYNDASSWAQTVISRGPGNGFLVKNKGTANALTVHDLDVAKDMFTIDGSGNVKHLNSSNFYIYSDNGTTAKFTVAGATGNTSIAGTLSVTGAITGSLSGNASTATKLQTARTFALTGAVTGSGSFDGSGNLSIATTAAHTHDDRYYTETEINNKFASTFKSVTGAIFTSRGTTHTVTDTFCTAASLVTIIVTGTVNPQGVWKVDSQAGKFVITSDIAETADVTFDYFIQKAAV